MKKSDDYHDYVFKDGHLIAAFDEMYCYSKEVPWHQDKTAYSVFVDLDLAILKHFSSASNVTSICDLGCGLGYVTDRLNNELLPPRQSDDVRNVTGIDISSNAVAKAKALFPHIDFYSLDILKDDIRLFEEQFDLLYMKDIFWYITQDADRFIQTARSFLKPNGCIYIMQSFPDKKEFIGSNLFPNTYSFGNWCSSYFDNIYTSSTYEFFSETISADRPKDRYLRFLGRKTN